MSVSILTLSLVLSTSAHAEQWFRLKMDAPIFYGLGSDDGEGVPDLGGSNFIEFLVNGAAGTSADGRDLGDLNIPIAVTGIDSSYTVDIADLPAGATWSGGALLWSPAVAGTYTPTIEVRDAEDELVASQTIVLTIHPQLQASVPQTIYEVDVGDNLTITPTVDNLIDGVQWGSTPADLPDWLELDASTGVIDVDTTTANDISNLVLTAVDQADLFSASTLPFSITVNGDKTRYWISTLGGSASDLGQSISAGSDGSVYVTGVTQSAGAGSFDILIAKYDADGTLTWKKTLGGAVGDYGYSVAAVSDGSVYVAGYTDSAGAGGSDLLIAKYGTDGTLTWSKTLGGTSGDYGRAITAGSDGSVYVTGYTQSAGAGSNDVLIARYGADGTLTWKKTLGGAAPDHGQSITAGSDGSVYISGHTQSVGAGSNKVLIAKYGADGTLTWMNTLGGASYDYGQSITAGSDGSVYVTGNVQSAGAGGSDLLIAKYSADGALTWKKTLGGASGDYGNSITAGSDGSIYVTGYTQSAGAGSNDVLIAKYGADGALAWKKTLGGASTDVGFSITAGSDGALYVTGYTTTSAGPGPGSTDILIARLPVDGGDDMAAGPFTFQDAALTEGTASSLSVSTPSWGSPHASSVTSGTGSTLANGDASALTSTTTEFEQQVQP